MTTTPTPTPLRIDPRIRERVIEVRRQAGRKRLRWLLVVLSVLILSGLAYLAVTSPLLDVDSVRVAGTSHVTVDAVRDASGVDLRDPLVFVDSSEVARRVETLPWVEHATVQRDFPGTVKIVVTEHTPVAYVRTGNQMVLLASNGRALARVAAADVPMVEVRGVRRAPAIGERLAPAEAAGLVARLPSALAERVTAIDLDGGLTLVLSAGEIRLTNDDALDAKAAAALSVLEHLGDTPFTYIDVSTPTRPVSHS